ncbi:hypothetical protein PFISCL1PPCAC_2255, partial [Pristionchus fissidentatus]
LRMRSFFAGALTVLILLSIGVAIGFAFRGRAGPPEYFQFVSPPEWLRKHVITVEKKEEKRTKPPEIEEEKEEIDNSIVTLTTRILTASTQTIRYSLRLYSGPPKKCKGPRDPLKKPKSPIEEWFTKEMFEDLFPFANLGWGPDRCFPYSYEAFSIAARYFPEFGTTSSNKVYSSSENHRRDLAAFFAHAVQETGENNAGLYLGGRSDDEAADCFYRGGFYNWFEGGPTSSFLDPKAPGYAPENGDKCLMGGRYCAESAELNHFFGCYKEKDESEKNTTDRVYTGCYFGRGAIQISYNYNYGMFQDWLHEQVGIDVDLLTSPNLVMTKLDPPLAVMASLWFYMTPQPPKPAMHDIVMGDWNSGEKNAEAGYSGPIFGPTSLIINNECNGEDVSNPGGPGESRRIKAFKWFCRYFEVPAGDDRMLTCKDMPVKLDMIPQKMSYQPDWSTTWKQTACECAPANYGGMIPYFDPDFYPARFVALNGLNKQRCEDSVYANPKIMDSDFAPLAVYFSIGAGCILVAAVMNKLREKRSRLDQYADMPEMVKEPLRSSSSLKRSVLRSMAVDDVTSSSHSISLQDIFSSRQAHEYLTVRISDSDTDEIPGLYSAKTHDSNSE